MSAPRVNLSSRGRFFFFSSLPAKSLSTAETTGFKTVPVRTDAVSAIPVVFLPRPLLKSSVTELNLLIFLKTLKHAALTAKSPKSSPDSFLAL